MLLGKLKEGLTVQAFNVWDSGDFDGIAPQVLLRLDDTSRCYLFQSTDDTLQEVYVGGRQLWQISMAFNHQEVIHLLLGPEVLSDFFNRYFLSLVHETKLMEVIIIRKRRSSNEYS
jgi:hypothetical protein